MSARGARLAAVAVVLATLAAAPAAFPFLLPDGLALDFAPLHCAKEIAAGLVLWALVFVPASLAADEARGAEDHGSLLSMLAGAPVVTALVLAAGGNGAALLPLLALVLLVDLAASSYLRADAPGSWSPAWVGGCMFLSFGVPLLGWALDDLGGWKGAWEWRRFSPVFAARTALAPGQGDPWSAVLPPIWILLGASAVLRLVAIPRGRPPKTAVVAAALALCLVPATAMASEVLVVGAPREGPALEVMNTLRSGGATVEEVPNLPDTLSPETRGLLLARLPAPGEEEAAWRATLSDFLDSGGVVAVLPASETHLAISAAGEGASLGRVIVLAGGALSEQEADTLRQPRTSLRHPLEIHPAGVLPDLHRIPFSRAPAPLPVRTFAYLAVVALLLVPALLLSPGREEASRLRRLRPAGLALLATGLLFLPGLAGEELLLRRLVLEERASPTARSARRILLVEAERVRPGNGPVEVRVERARWAGIPWEAGVPAGVEVSEASLRFEIPEPGHRAMAVGVSGASVEPATTPFLWSFVVIGEEAWPEAPGMSADAPAVRNGEGESWARVLDELRRSPDPSVARPAAALRALFQSPPGGGACRVGAMPGGADAVVVHLR
jgi:hypothetical protein